MGVFMAITISSNNRIFCDLDLNFTANPITGDVSMKYDDNAVKQSIKNLILMRPYESPFHPEISSQVNNLLFELATPVTVELIRTTIIQVITKFESRVQNFDVTVVDNSDLNAYQVTVEFIIKGSDTSVTVNTLLYRSR
jgi:predicted component of type VI protein secretion system